MSEPTDWQVQRITNEEGRPIHITKGDYALMPWEEWERRQRAISFLLFVTHNSRGLDGYHLNGDVAEWEEFEEFAEIEENRRALEGK